MKFINLTMGLLLIFILNGCIFITKYPNALGKIKDVENIPTLINGTYNCKGKTVSSLHPDYNKSYLPSSLKLKIVEYQQRCNTIHFKQSNVNTIDVKISYEDNVTIDLLLKKNIDYFYNDGQLYLNDENDCASTNGVILCESGNRYINFNENKDLIIENTSFALGSLLIVIPVGGYENSWRFFKNID